MQTGDARTSGDPSEQASGNGSIMRLAPVPIRYADLFPDQLDELVRLLVESSLPTHASPQCLSACAYMGLVLCGLIHGLRPRRSAGPDWQPLAAAEGIPRPSSRGGRGRRGELSTEGAARDRRRGYVVKSLEAALWAFHDAKDFREAVLRAVNLGDDADTTGAICGQLAGAYWGESGIPQEWRDGLARREMIEQALQGLLDE